MITCFLHVPVPHLQMTAGDEWPHVTCCLDSLHQQRVCGLNLSSMDLEGQIPALGKCAGMLPVAFAARWHLEVLISTTSRLALASTGCAGLAGFTHVHRTLRQHGTAAIQRSYQHMCA